MIAFRDRLRAEGLAEWTVESNLMTVITMLKHNPLKRVTGLLKPQDWPEIPDSEPNPYTMEKPDQQALILRRDPLARLSLPRRNRVPRAGNRTLRVDRHQLGRQDRMDTYKEMRRLR